MNNKEQDFERLGNWESQVRKGTLDFIILICLEQKRFYGYELIRTIKEIAEINVSEGTIYPLLNRLKKDGCVVSEWVEMESGIPRKYYRITDKGKTLLGSMQESWQRFNESIERLRGKL